MHIEKKFEPYIQREYLVGFGAECSEFDLPFSRIFLVCGRERGEKGDGGVRAMVKCPDF